MAEENKNDPLIQLAELLRRPKGVGVEARSAILNGTDRVDIIRGKDLVRWVKANMDKINLPITRGKTQEEVAEALASLFLRRQLLVRCERRFTKPPPGMSRPAKFPKKVLVVGGTESMRFVESDFYAWTWDRPMSAMTYVLAGLGALAVILVCLFPVAPMWVKAGVVYLASGLLALIMGVLVLRGMIALASYIGTGRTVWVLPNVLADDKPLSELFSPMIGVQEPKPRENASDWAKHIGTRVAVGAATAAFVVVLLRNAPDRDSIKREAGEYRDALFDLLKVSDRKLLGDQGTKSGGGAGGRGSATPPPKRSEATPEPVFDASSEDNVEFEAQHGAAGNKEEL